MEHDSAAFSTLLKQVIDGEIKEAEFKAPPGDLIAILEDEYDASRYDPMDTNGWQADYWQKLTIGDDEYMLSGCMYYGTAEFRKVVK